MFYSTILRRVIQLLRPRRGLAHSDHWEITAPSSLAGLFRALPAVFEDEAILYLESNGTPAKIKRYLNERRSLSTLRIKGGTVLPTPEVFRLPLTAENVDGLAQLLESERNVGICTHVHVYRGDAVLLEWYDASAGDPVLIDSSVPERIISSLCATLGCEYHWKGDPRDGLQT